MSPLTQDRESWDWIFWRTEGSGGCIYTPERKVRRRQSQALFRHPVTGPEATDTCGNKGDSL